ncbi:hypothetical protein BGLA2_990063 [Burkholderia gladioli]|nr:hypothetical protein BGLA2_990063 [Burkholderia gladioli]
MNSSMTTGRGASANAGNASKLAALAQMTERIRANMGSSGVANHGSSFAGAVRLRMAVIKHRGGFGPLPCMRQQPATSERSTPADRAPTIPASPQSNRERPCRWNSKSRRESGMWISGARIVEGSAPGRRIFSRIA